MNFPQNSPHKKPAFTLAEVLITLAIIGIVAALTIPNLIHTYQDKAYVGKLKETQSIFAQAIRTAYAEGETANWGDGDDETSTLAVIDGLRKHIKISHECGFDDSDYICFSEKASTNLKNKLYENSVVQENYFYKFILLNGVSLAIYYFQSGDDDFGWLVVDINGSKPPNIYGQDIFDFDFAVLGRSSSNLPPQALPMISPSGNESNSECSITDTYQCTYQVLTTGKIMR